MLGYLLGLVPVGLLARAARQARGHPQGRLGQHRRDERLAHLRPLARRAGRPARRAEGLRPGAARDALRLAAPPVRASAPARRRCSATGGRSSCASRRAGRWSRPAAACSSASRSGSRSPPASSGSLVVPDAPLRVARLDRRRASRCRSRAIALGYPTLGVLFGAAAAAAIVYLHRGNLAPPARGHRAPLPAQAHGQCVRRSSLARRSRRRSGSRRAHSPRAGAAARRRVADRPARHRHRRAGARGRRDSRPTRPTVRRRREPARRRRRVDDRVVAGQDPTRVPRFDLATFAGGTCLDISFVRLPQPASAYSRRATRAFDDDRGTQLARRGLASRYKTTSSTTTARRSSTDVCGTGGGRLRQGRPSRSSGCTAARTCRPTRSRRTSCCTRSARCRRCAERLHAPPTRGDADAGHPCDSPTDVLYPYATGGRSRSSSSTSTTTTTTATAALERHPGLDLAASPGHAGGGARSHHLAAPGT